MPKKAMSLVEKIFKRYALSRKVSISRKDRTSFIHSDPDPISHVSIVREEPDLKWLLGMLNLSSVHRKHCLRLFACVCLFFIPTPLNRVGGRSYICIFIFYHFFLFRLFCRFKYRLMPFLRIAYILSCIYSCSAVNDDSHSEGGENAPFLKLAK